MQFRSLFSGMNHPLKSIITVSTILAILYHLGSCTTTQQERFVTRAALTSIEVAKTDPDLARHVEIAGSLLSPETRPAAVADILTAYTRSQTADLDPDKARRLLALWTLLGGYLEDYPYLYEPIRQSLSETASVTDDVN